MNISFNITPGYTNPIGIESTQQSQKPDKTLTVTITSGEGVQTTGGATAITLSYPLIGPEDIAINELLSQLENMDVASLQGMTSTAAALLVNQMVFDLAGQIKNGGVEFIRNNSAEIEKALEQIETQANHSASALFELLNNSNYPDFNSFLSMMLDMAQELRELASEARHHMVMGEYNNILEQSEVMMETAQKNYEAAMKEVEATRMQAIGKIVSGAVSIVTTGIGGIGGGFAGAQFGAQVGTMFGNIIDGSFSLAAAQDQLEAAGLKKDAEENSALLKKFEASQKLLQEAQTVLQEMRDIAKTLSDMILKLYQDFIQNQSQIVQRSNI